MEFFPYVFIAVDVLYIFRQDIEEFGTSVCRLLLEESQSVLRDGEVVMVK